MKVTLLGCGGSGGVPLVGGADGAGEWGACDPGEPRNRRRRVSILVEAPGEAGQGTTAILVDCSPDLRLQLLDAKVKRLDAVLFTHDHADHSHGLDELRALVRRSRQPIPAFMDARTRARLTAHFAYAFASAGLADPLYPPLLDDRPIDGPFDIGPIRVVPFAQEHGKETTLGFRFGDLAYSTDVSGLSEAAFAALRGTKLWIVDCLRDQPHPTHAHFSKTLEWIARVRPTHAVLTHMNQDLDYRVLAARCPPGVEPGYDGLTIKLP